MVSWGFYAGVRKNGIRSENARLDPRIYGQADDSREALSLAITRTCCIRLSPERYIYSSTTQLLRLTEVGLGQFFLGASSSAL